MYLVNLSLAYFYLYEKNKFSVVPQLGFAGEVYEANYSHKQFQKETAGDIVFGKFGCKSNVVKAMNLIVPSEKFEALK